jgi:pyruvate formate lyase activating enzyme
MKNIIEAKYYSVKSDERVECGLCPHNCIIKPDKTGICGVRKNIHGKLYTLIYGEVTGLAMDPIEKKPLYHFYPGSRIISIGTKGCNFKCSFCQNWHISQDLKAHTTYYSPEAIIDMALQNNSVGIAYTYSEPSIWFEYVLDCSVLARKQGFKNVLVTNGFINKEPLSELLPYTDAMNIDLKSFKESTYTKIEKGKLENVLTTIKIASEKCHVELTTLVVTGINDDISEMRDIIEWISSVNKNIPWHVSRYSPNFKYDAPPTDVEFIVKVCEEASKKLNYVYSGNISDSYGSNNTICPSCKNTAVTRIGYLTRITGLTNGKCSKCGFDLNIKQ